MNAPVVPTGRVPMQVFVIGKIDDIRRFKGDRYTRILTPAPDAYSRPQTIQIRSKGQLGQKGEEISVMATLGGYTRKSYKSEDPDTHETTMVTPVDMTLDAIE